MSQMISPSHCWLVTTQRSAEFLVQHSSSGSNETCSESKLMHHGWALTRSLAEERDGGPWRWLARPFPSSFRMNDFPFETSTNVWLSSSCCCCCCWITRWMDWKRVLCWAVLCCAVPCHVIHIWNRSEEEMPRINKFNQNPNWYLIKGRREYATREEGDVSSFIYFKLRSPFSLHQQKFCEMSFTSLRAAANFLFYVHTSRPPPVTISIHCTVQYNARTRRTPY